MKTPKEGDIWKYNAGVGVYRHYIFVELIKKDTSGEEMWEVMVIEKGRSETIAWWPNPQHYYKVA